MSEFTLFTTRNHVINMVCARNVCCIRTIKSHLVISANSWMKVVYVQHKNGWLVDNREVLYEARRSTVERLIKDKIKEQHYCKFCVECIPPYTQRFFIGKLNIKRII